MNDADREWHLGHLREGARLNVVCTLAMAQDGRTVAELAAITGHSTSTVRNALDHALRIGWAAALEGDPNPGTGRRSVRYRMTGIGRQELAALTWVEPVIDTPVIDADEASIAVDDQPSSTAMTTGIEIKDRRGKPDWCTPEQPCTICARVRKP